METSLEIVTDEKQILVKFSNSAAQRFEYFNNHTPEQCSLSVSTCFFKYPSISLSMHIFKKSNVFFFAVDINYDSKYVLLCAQSELFSAST